MQKKNASKRAIPKAAEATGDLIGNKIADKITSASKKSTKELPNDEKEVDVERATPKKRYISPEGKKKLLMNYGWYNNTKMEYQKIANLLDRTSNQSSKFRTTNRVEINDDIRRVYSPNKQIRFKTAMLRSSLCDYSDAYILVKGNITVNNTAADGAAANNTNKKVIFKNCAPFTNCISKINNTQIDNAEYIDIVMPMYNLIEYSDNYSKTSGSLWQYCKEIAPVDNNGSIADFNGANATDSFNFKTKITGQTDNNGSIKISK